MSAASVAIFVHLQEILKDKDPPLAPESSKSVLLLGVGYMGVIINCSSTITSFLIIDKLVEVPLYASRIVPIDLHTGPLNELFEFYFPWKLWYPLRNYCACLYYTYPRYILSVLASRVIQPLPRHLVYFCRIYSISLVY